MYGYQYVIRKTDVVVLFLSLVTVYDLVLPVTTYSSYGLISGKQWVEQEH